MPGLTCKNCSYYLAPSLSMALAVVVIWAMMIEIAFARNLPYRIEHDAKEKALQQDKRAIEESQFKHRQAEQDYQRALNQARKYKGLAPTYDGEYGYQRMMSEHALQQAQQNLRNQESDLNALHRRYESRQRDLELRNSRDRNGQGQQPFPRIERSNRF